MEPIRDVVHRPLVLGWMDEVVQGVWVGQWEAADWLVDTRQTGWAIICTLEVPRNEDQRPETLCLPTLEHRPGEGEQGAPADWVATRGSLEAIAQQIDLALVAGLRVLAYCGVGIERSPLAVAWWLTTRRGVDLNQAYGMLRAARPGVVDRRLWMARDCRTAAGC